MLQQVKRRKPTAFAGGSALAAMIITACSVYSEQDLVGALGSRGSGGSAGSGGVTGGPSGGITGMGGATGGVSEPAGGSGEGGLDAGAAGSDSGSGGLPGAGGVPAGSGGAPGTGGVASGGTAGSQGGSSGGSLSAEQQALVDDLEDKNAFLLPFRDRTGSWYVAKESTASATPSVFETALIPTGDTGFPANSLSAVRFKASGGTNWGATVGFDLTKPTNSTTKIPYDASAYRGIRFFAKGAASNTQIVVRVPIKDTSTFAGGACIGPKLCDDHYQHGITLGTQWAEHEILWGALMPMGWGLEVDFKATELISVEFQVPAGGSAEFWIDDVAFVL